MKINKLFMKLSICVASLAVLCLLMMQISSKKVEAGVVECSIERFREFNALLDLEREAFISYRFDVPESCQDQCRRSCNSISNPNDKQICINNIPTCASNCRSTRYNAYLSAYQATLSMGSLSCPAIFDYCGTARMHRDECSSRYQINVTNPIYNPDGSVNQEWQNQIDDENSRCQNLVLNELEENQCQ